MKGVSTSLQMAEEMRKTRLGWRLTLFDQELDDVVVIYQRTSRAAFKLGRRIEAVEDLLEAAERAIGLLAHPCCGSKPAREVLRQAVAKARVPRS
jgi:hypothetical protein